MTADPHAGPGMIEIARTGAQTWTRATLPPDAGQRRLDGACLGELLDAVQALRANPLPVLALSPDDFELPACRRLMANVKEALDHGVGFVVLDRLPLERLTADEAVGCYWLLSRLLARPVAQKWDGTMIYDVLDTGRAPGNGVRPDQTNVEQNFHTDNSYNLCPPEYVGLLCLETAMEGGVSRIVSFGAVHEAMRRHHPQLLPRLYRPFYFDRQREHAPGDVMVTHHPVFESTDGRLTSRHSLFQVKNGHDLAGTPLDDEGRRALEALEAVMNDPAMSTDFVFERGQIQWINNRTIGHKRTGFRDWPDRKRRLVRLWLRDAGRAFYNG
jgi:alpha-ketoglutarate-dependent taurine dioxygenase